LIDYPLTKRFMHIKYDTSVFCTYISNVCLYCSSQSTFFFALHCFGPQLKSFDYITEHCIS